ncbi:MAG: hypothetical protein R3F33_08400 [Planctomycetota bacterium]
MNRIVFFLLLLVVCVAGWGMLRSRGEVANGSAIPVAKSVQASTSRPVVSAIADAPLRAPGISEDVALQESPSGAPAAEWEPRMGEPGAWGEFGFYSSEAAARASLAQLAQAMLPILGKTPMESSHQWTARWTEWEFDGRKQADPPIWSLTPGGPSQEQVQAAVALVRRYDALVREQEFNAYNAVQAAIGEYLETRVVKIPWDQPHEGSQFAQGAPKSSWEAYTEFQAGKWKFVLDFRTVDFPNAEGEIQRLKDLVRERNEAMIMLLRGTLERPR